MTDASADPHRRTDTSLFRSAAYSRAALARLALSEQARVLADGAALLVPTMPGPHARAGGLVGDAAMLVEEAQRLLTLAVICERTQGVSWERIGLALGEAGRRTVSRQAAHERYADAERDFRERLLHAWLRPEQAGEVLATADHLAQIIARLNAWVSARQEVSESIGAGLTPMDTAERSTLIAQAESLLATMAVTSGVSDEEREALETGLCRRKIELYEDLAARAPGDPTLLKALADARTRLAELRAGDG